MNPEATWLERVTSPTEISAVHEIPCGGEQVDICGVEEVYVWLNKFQWRPQISSKRKVKRFLGQRHGLLAIISFLSEALVGLTEDHKFSSSYWQLAVEYGFAWDPHHIVRVQPWGIKARRHTLAVKRIEIEELAVLSLQGN